MICGNESGKLITSRGISSIKLELSHASPWFLSPPFKTVPHFHQLQDSLNLNLRWFNLRRNAADKLCWDIKEQRPMMPFLLAVKLPNKLSLPTLTPKTSFNKNRPSNLNGCKGCGIQTRACESTRGIVGKTCATSSGNRRTDSSAAQTNGRPSEALGRVHEARLAEEVNRLMVVDSASAEI
ncbi:hypothetical protein VNO80_08605 [Phaseolus coccineus]|uniref:Uncharacterized protein n=1 Tax=Phaseolus coccineus TaxID=3886 RepID=A0AAN9N4T1_PHACN